jgi:hypothetical protein
MNIFRILTRAHTLSIFLLNTTDDYNKKLPSSSSPAYPYTFESVHGAGPPGVLMRLNKVAAPSREVHSDTEMEDQCT